MKITLVGPVYPYRGGIAHYTAHLAQKLAARGDIVQMISFRRQYPAWLYPGQTDKDPSRLPLRVPAAYLLDPLNPLSWRRAVNEIDAFSPAVIGIQWWTTFWGPGFGALAWGLARKTGQVIFMVHNVLPHEQKPWDATLARLALAQGQGFIAHTEAEKARLLALLPKARVLVCPLPAYDHRPNTAISPTTARAALGLPAERPVLLAFGIVRPYKGLGVLLDALGLLRKRGLCPYLLVAGEFWDDKARYLAQIERLGLQGDVRLDDRYVPDEEVAHLFAASDALIAPYIGGTQSAVASWGLGAGLPLIISEKVAAGLQPSALEQAIVTRTGSPENLAEAIAAFLQAGGQATRLAPPAASGWEAIAACLQTFAEE